MKTKLEAITIEQIVKAIKIPTAEWHGNCYFIACSILRAGIVRGRPAYGHYLGPVATTGYWASRRGQAFQRHGWIVVDDFDETILDPTRWSFEDRKPYLHLHNCGDHEYTCADCGLVPEEHGVIEDSCIDFRKQRCEYDEGGNQLRESMETSPPRFSSKDEAVSIAFPPAAFKHVMGLLGFPKGITKDMLFWLGNLSVRRLGMHAPDIYKAFKEANEIAMIPIDNRILVLGDKED